MRAGKVQTRNRKKRGQRGFSLIAVISVSVVMFLIATTLFLKVGAQRSNAVAQRGESESFYAADAGINALAGRLSALGFGTNTIPSSALPFITTSNLTGLTQSDVTAAVLDGTISLSTTYQGATPQNNGDDLGSLVYSFKAVACQAGTSNGANALCSADESNVISTFPLPANIARIDVMSVGSLILTAERD
jgi:type II secretory pathway pseudopilin PulG